MVPLSACDAAYALMRSAFLSLGICYEILLTLSDSESLVDDKFSHEKKKWGGVPNFHSAHDHPQCLRQEHRSGCLMGKYHGCVFSTRSPTGPI